MFEKVHAEIITDQHAHQFHAACYWRGGMQNYLKPEYYSFYRSARYIFIYLHHDFQCYELVKRRNNAEIAKLKRGAQIGSKFRIEKFSTAREH